MRRDLIIGILASVFFHVTFIYSGDINKWIGRWLHKGKTKAPVAVVEDVAMVQIEMPPLEPDKPDISEEENTSTEAVPVQFAPPMQTDVPTIAMADSFVQQIQPPPPEGLRPNPSLVTIPPTRAGHAPPSTALKNVFNLAELDQPIEVRYKIAPIYPYEMKRLAIRGEVVVGFIVDIKGDVREPYVVKSTHREFESAAIQAILKWKFRAGKKGGKAVNVRAEQPIEFSLEDEEPLP